MSSLHRITFLLYYIHLATSTPSPTFFEPSNEYCTSQHFDSNDYIIDAQTTTSFLDEDDNLFWIKLYEPNEITLQKRNLFTINTNYNFNPQYNNIILTTNIHSNFNNDSQYYINNINPKFFITDNNRVKFTGTTCNGTSPLSTGAIPDATTSISYINGNNINTLFVGIHIQISIHMNRTDSNTFAVVKWTDSTTNNQYESICQYNNGFGTSDIIFTTYVYIYSINTRICNTMFP